MGDILRSLRKPGEAIIDPSRTRWRDARVSSSEPRLHGWRISAINCSEIRKLGTAAQSPSDDAEGGNFKEVKDVKSSRRE